MTFTQFIYGLLIITSFETRPIDMNYISFTTDMHFENQTSNRKNKIKTLVVQCIQLTKIILEAIKFN